MGVSINFKVRTLIRFYPGLLNRIMFNLMITNAII